MASKFMRVKKLVIPTLTLIILVSQLSGCAVMSSNEMVDMINQGRSITIELPKPAYDIVIKGQQQEDIEWVQLDQLKTFNQGFRQGVDEVFNINIVTENGINGKSGCLYVDEAGDRNGNTTLEDALRNKVFVTKYWQDADVKTKLAKLANEVYTDVDGNDTYAILGAINAYYNLMPNAENPSSFNPTQSLTREDFYTLAFKTEEGVRDINVDKRFADAVGGETKFTKFAQEVDEYGFLSVANKSLDANSYKGSISRAEAVYMMVNKHFPEELAKVTGKEQAFKDTKNAGDLALKVGFKYKDKETKEILGKDRWQAYTLAYMIQNPDKGLQDELYKAMVVAKQAGLISGDESRWDEPISKAEAIQLVINTHLAKNNLYGYLSKVEYGKNDLSKFTVESEDPYKVIGVDEEGMKYGKDWVQVPKEQFKLDPNTKLENGLTLAQAKQLINELGEKWIKEGVSADEVQKRQEFIAKDMGTTLETLEALPNTTVNNSNTESSTKPSSGSTKPSSGSTSGSSSSSGKTSGGSSSGSSSSGSNWREDYEKLPDWQKEFTIDPDEEMDFSVPDSVKDPFEGANN